LLGNALKYTPENGSINVSAAAFDFTSIKVSIGDTGPGIPDDKKHIIFERFSQLGNKDRRGLGLGLYISRKIIEAHSGKLWVESVANQGSIFSFTLPHFFSAPKNQLQN
jgi:two-component system clock-associated histidine kinase SasA